MFEKKCHIRKLDYTFRIPIWKWIQTCLMFPYPRHCNKGTQVLLHSLILLLQNEILLCGEMKRVELTTILADYVPNCDIKGDSFFLLKSAIRASKLLIHVHFSFLPIRYTMTKKPQKTISKIYNRTDCRYSYNPYEYSYRR